MARLILGPTIIPSVGTHPKVIREYVGRVNSDDDTASVAHMTSPEGWEEPGQTPDFVEFTLVLSGCLRVETREGAFNVRAGQAVVAPALEWVRYSTPEPGGADYVAVCVPAFTPGSAYRDA